MTKTFYFDLCKKEERERKQETEEKEDSNQKLFPWKNMTGDPW